MSENDAFDAFRARPTRDSVVAFLRAWQGRIFRLCYQVLRNVHDAEDATQGVLLKIVTEARRFPDPESFRRWLHRVCLNAALETARKAGRRREHESRAAMENDPRPPVDPSTRLALFDALASLEDGPRELLLDHYFEGRPLDAIAAREGVSAPAICKRMDGARESLRRRLGGVAAVFPLERMFVSAPAAPDMVTGAVLAKAHSTAAALAAGGLVVASKTSIVTAVGITALICLSVGTGFGVLLRSRAAPDDRAQVVELQRQLANALQRSSVQKPAAPLDGTASLPTPAPVEMSVKEAVTSKLKAKLARYRSWVEAYLNEQTEVLKKHAGDPETIKAYQAAKQAELGEMLIGMRELICASPREFLEFLRQVDNERYLTSLITRGLGFYISEGQTRYQEYGSFPRELTDGMLDLLKTGSRIQKMSILQFFQSVVSQPDEVRAVYPQLLQEQDSYLQLYVVQAISHTSSWTPEVLTNVVRLGHATDSLDLRMAIANGMTTTTSPEAVSYLIDRLEITNDHNEAVSVGQAIDMKLISLQGVATVEQQDRIARAILTAIGKEFDGATYLVVVRAGLALPVEKLKPILQQAHAQAPTDNSRKTIENLIQLVNAGQSTAVDLRKASWGEK